MYALYYEESRKLSSRNYVEPDKLVGWHSDISGTTVSVRDFKVTRSLRPRRNKQRATKRFVKVICKLFRSEGALAPIPLCSLQQVP